MPALFPNTVAPEDFSIGQVVRKFISGHVSQYTGEVTHISPNTYKVWVNWAVGGSMQEDPETLVKVPDTQYQSPVGEDTRYPSYDKTLSDKLYGTVSPTVIMLAKKIAANSITVEENKNNIQKMATRIANTFATDIVGSLVKEIEACKSNNMTDIQAYEAVYPAFSNRCSDGFLRTAIHKCYN
jgi:hypothetical protein